MKRMYITILLLFSGLSITMVSAQNINAYLDVIQVDHGYDCGNDAAGACCGCWISVCNDPDPRWKFYGGYSGGSFQGPTVINGGERGCGAWNIGDADVANFTNIAATQINIDMESWEEDGCGGDTDYNTGCANDDDARTSRTRMANVNFRTVNPCQYNQYGWYYGNNGYGAQYDIYWEYAVAPTITTQPTVAGADRNLCVGSSTTLTVAVNTDASNPSISLGRFYQWQVSTNTDCGAATGWINISGATSASYIPPQTPGTRLYRCLITSNCTANFTTNTATSNCVRVNYYPYAPDIISAVCNASVSVGSTHTFSIPTAPAANAIANATYSWSCVSCPAAPVFSSTTAASTNVTFPNTPGSYTIRITVDETPGIGCAAAFKDCPVTVSAPDCNFVYVSPTGGLTGGSTNNPVNFTTAFGLLSSSRNHIRMLEGTYNISSVVNIPAGVVIEGGFRNTGGVWTKRSDAVSTIRFNGYQTIDGDIAQIIGFRSINSSNWILQDLTIITENAVGTTTSGNGKSNYAIYISGASSIGYQIIRCNISAGNASGGSGAITGWQGAVTYNGTPTDPFDGNNGQNGFKGADGNQGECSCGDDDGGSGGTGGSIGAGGFGPGGNGAGGAVGGSGGRGEHDWSGSGPAVAGTSSACASGGAYGAGGSTGRCGSNGTSCTINGSPGLNGSTIPSAISGGYFLPSYGSNGIGGNGGGGGGVGGGGGFDDSGCDASGAGGSGGGGGGGGGGAGKGGRGGGSSYGVFLTSTAGSGIFLNTLISAGTAGSGGLGGEGGAGGTGGVQGESRSQCDEGGCGGRGGAGSSGGKGGNGGNANAGVSYAYSINGANSTSPSTTLPSPAGALIVNYNNRQACTNSYVSLQRASTNAWTNYGANGDEVFDITSALQSNTTASNPVDVYYTTTGWKDITAGTDTRTRLLYVNTPRTPPVINGVTSPICKDGSLSLTVTPNSPSAVTGYEWTIQATPVTGLNVPVPTLTSNSATPTFIFPNTGTTDITYQVKLRVQDECCGWSIPVYATVVVKPEILPGSIIAGPQTICYNGDPANITSVTAPSNTVGTIVYKWQYSDNCTGTWVDIASSDLVEYNPPSGLTVQRCYRRVTQNCSDEVYSNEHQVNVLPQFSAGAITGGTATVCYNGSSATLVANPVGGSGDYSYEWFYKASGNPCDETGWTSTGSTSSTYTPTGLTSGIMYRYTVDDIGSPDCAAATYSSNCFTVAVIAPVSDAVAGYTIPPCANPSNPYAELSATAPVTGSGTWSVISGPGALASTTANPTLITGLSATAATTLVKWEVVYTSGLACPKSDTLSITPVSALNFNAVSLQSSSTPQYFSCNTCTIKNNNTYTYYDNSGKIIAKIQDLNAPGSELGSTEVCMGYDYNANSVTPTSSSVNTVLTNYADYQPYLPRYWTIKPATNTDVIVTLYYTAAELNALQAKAVGTAYQFGNFYDLWMTKYPNGTGGTFTAPASTGGVNVPVVIARYPSPATGPDYSATFSVNSFSTFYLHPVRFPFAPLPVELTSFTGWNQGSVNRLQWVTASELNTDRFEVEKSLKAADWRKLGEVASAGNSNQPITYDFADNHPVVGNNYYRLKMIDKDGTFSYSNIINIAVSDAVQSGFVSVYPNPTGGNLHVEIQSVAELNTMVVVYDIVGKRVFEETAALNRGLNTLLFNFNSLANGAYILQFSDADGKIYSTKFVKD